MSTRRSIALVYVGYAFRYLYLFILVPFYGRVLGPAEYGRLLAAMSTMQMVWTVCDWGFSIAGTRDTGAAESREQRAIVYGRQISARLTLVLPALALGLIATLSSPVLREVPAFGVLATVAGVVSAFNLGWYFRGTQDFIKSVGLEVSGFAVNLLSILFLVQGPKDGWVVLAVLAGSSVLLTGAAHLLALSRLPRRSLTLRGGRATVRECTPLFMHRGATIMMASSTTYLLSLFVGEAELGFYGAADRIAGVSQIMLQPVGQVLVGSISRHLRDGGERAAGYRQIRLGLLAMSGVGAIITLGALFFARPGLPLILGSRFLPSAYLLQVLTLSLPFAGILQGCIELILIPLRRDDLVSRISTASTASGILLMIAAVQLGGIQGAAWCRVLTVSASTCAVLWLLWQNGILRAIVFQPAAIKRENGL